MTRVQVLLLALAFLCSCGDEGTTTPTDQSIQLNEGEQIIGTYAVEPSGSATFEHVFSEPIWIGFYSNISSLEIERFDNEEAVFASVEIRQIGSDRFVSSHRGGATVFTPISDKPDQFEIFNRSREKLTVTVYWKAQ